MDPPSKVNRNLQSGLSKAPSTLSSMLDGQTVIPDPVSVHKQGGEWQARRWRQKRGDCGLTSRQLFVSELNETPNTVSTVMMRNTKVSSELNRNLYHIEYVLCISEIYSCMTSLLLFSSTNPCTTHTCELWLVYAFSYTRQEWYHTKLQQDQSETEPWTCIWHHSSVYNFARQSLPGEGVDIVG